MCQRKFSFEWQNFIVGNASDSDFGRLLGRQSPDCVGDGNRASETTVRGSGSSSWRVTGEERKKIPDTVFCHV